jgi:hypothetical protein
VVIKPLQNADMRQAKRTAPFKDQADLLPWRRRASRLRRRILGLQGTSHEKQEEQRRCRQAPRSRAAFPVPAGCLIHRRSIIAHNGLRGIVPLLEHVLGKSTEGEDSMGLRAFRRLASPLLSSTDITKFLSKAALHVRNHGLLP